MLASLSIIFLNYLNYISGVLVSIILLVIAFKAIRKINANKKIAIDYESYFDSFGNINMRKYIKYKGTTHIIESILEDKNKNEYYTVIDNKKVYLDI